MKIISNPPFSGNLHLKILSKVIEQCKGAEIVNLSPIKWVNPLSYYEGTTSNDIIKGYDSIFKSLVSLESIDSKTAHDMFGTSDSNALGIYHIKTDDVSHTAFEYFPQSFDFVKRILDKADVCYNHATVIPKSAHFIRLPAIYGNENPVWLKKVCSDDFDRYYNLDKGAKHCAPYMNFDTKEECVNFHKSMSLKLVRYIHYMCRFGANTQMRALIYMPTYTRPWTDEMLYEYFGLTPDEIKEIEQEIK